MRLLMLGLDAAGKTSAFVCDILLRQIAGGHSFFTMIAILYKLKLDQSVTTIPTGSLLFLASMSLG
jgi:hypothetical protein